MNPEESAEMDGDADAVQTRRLPVNRTVHEIAIEPWATLLEAAR